MGQGDADMVLAAIVALQTRQVNTDRQAAGEPPLDALRVIQQSVFLAVDIAPGSIACQALDARRHCTRSAVTVFAAFVPLLVPHPPRHQPFHGDTKKVKGH